MIQSGLTPGRYVLVAVLALPVAACKEESVRGTDAPSTSSTDDPVFRRQLGKESQKIKRRDGRTLVWSGGGEPLTESAEWYDFTGAPFPPEQLQFGIGKDRIRAIDDPLFVKPDDPRIIKYVPQSPYRKDERPESNDEVIVIGHADGDDVRAYPIALLDRHELVNDRVGGKPVTVGW